MHCSMCPYTTYFIIFVIIIAIIMIIKNSGKKDSQKQDEYFNYEEQFEKCWPLQQTTEWK